jgi:signal peptidase I
MRVVFGRDPRRTFIRLLCTVAGTVILFRFLFIPIRVSGLSMYPTYREGKVNFVNHLAYRFKKPQRGDVVAVRIPGDDHAVLLKRIVGLPGERIAVWKGRVWINGELLAEPYAKNLQGASSRRELLLADDECFVIGDNRRISILGVVNERHILGKVMF